MISEAVKGVIWNRMMFLLEKEEKAEATVREKERKEEKKAVRRK